MLKIKTPLDIREEWVVALRSGKYSQAFGWHNDNNKRCALSLLFHDVLGMTSVDVYKIDNIESFLAEKVDLKQSVIKKIYQMNDGALGIKYCFHEIANYIEIIENQ
jgi:hypothetical protein